MLDALTLDQMRMFLAVADAGSFRLASMRLGRAQSAVSHAIANLETELKTVLFDRSTRRPTLTSDGRALLDDCRSLVLRADLLRAKAQGMGSGIEIELALMVDTLVPLPAVGRALEALHATYPTVGVRLQIGTLGEPIDCLLQGTVDLAITVGEDLRDPRLEFDSLAPLSMAAVVGAGHALALIAKKGRVSTPELADHIQIVLMDASPRSHGRDYGVLSQRKWRVGSQEAKLALIRAGIGWGRLPLWLIAQDLVEERLVQLSAAALGENGTTKSWVYLARRLDKPLLPAAMCLRSALLAGAGLGDTAGLPA
ncbi:MULTISPECIES: LysR family transcriptional regulator [unclassified Mesorhizobium]|uniref:LysR family transcriptional regulator n=1 Tax=unclassified Mesorhizobium TaxID=325217 RepID=UPI0024155A00|nr:MULTISPECIES: LysR family transcriptional regulator [unclassified Mesorhizobium]MDG4851923.1 LysR family transcriptional regulator [Mesorhizobium sp. WSM4982]MDG4911365.1 LysR family transcriptional regulator [Mesorhizobium sp. WSM4983]